MQEQDYSGERDKAKKRWLLISIPIICVISTVIAVTIVVRERVTVNQEEQILIQLAEQSLLNTSGGKVARIVPKPEATTGAEAVRWQNLTLEEKAKKLEEYFGIDIPEKNIDFVTLQEEINPDIYAWIYIPDTNIDYPVLQHPQDNTYYLNYNIDGSKGSSGCIFTENYNAKNFTDYNTVLYGSNMQDGTMFAGLHGYEDNEYFSKHPYIYIYTQDEVYIYRVFAAYNFSDVNLLLNYPVGIESGFASYLEELREVCISNDGHIDQEIEVTEKNRIITLSTGAAQQVGQRYLVQGVLLRIEEDSEIDSLQREEE